MAEAEVGGGAPLPPKRPTIIRPAAGHGSLSGDGKRPVPQRPAPARPAPPPPGNRQPPGVPQPASNDSNVSSLAKAPPSCPPAVPAPSAPARRPDPPAPAHDSKLGSKSKGSVKRRPEITIVDARPMSKAGFRHVKPQENAASTDLVPTVDAGGHITQGGAPAIPGRPASSSSSTTIKHLPPPSEPPPPIPVSRPGVHPPIPLVSPHSTPQPHQPVPAEDGPASELSDLSSQPSKPTILRPQHPASKADSNAKPGGGSSSTSPPPPVPKRSPVLDVPPPKPTRTAFSIQVAEDKAMELDEKTEENAVPKKPTRPSIIRPPLKRKSAVEEDEGREEEVSAGTADSEHRAEPSSPRPGLPPPPARPAAAVPGSPQEAASVHVSHSDSAPPVPAARPRVSPREHLSSLKDETSESLSGPDASHQSNVPPADRPRPPPVPPSRPHMPSSAGGTGSASTLPPAKPPPPSPARTDVSLAGGDGSLPEPLVASRPSKPARPHVPPEDVNVSAFHASQVMSGSSSGAAQPSRPPPPVPASRPQPPPPQDRPLPPVPSPAGEVSPPGLVSHLYEEVEVVSKTHHELFGATPTDHLVPNEQPSPGADSVDSLGTEEDVSALYAKVNKPKKTTPHSGEESPSGAAAVNPFGVRLKHVAEDAPADSEHPGLQHHQTSQDAQETVMKKPPVTKPKPSTLPKPKVATKPKIVTATEPSALADTQQQGSSPQPSPTFDETELTKPKPTVKRPTIIRPGRPGPEPVDDDSTERSMENEPVIVRMREKNSVAAPRPQSFTDKRGEILEQKSNAKFPVPSRRPVTIIGFPHKEKTSEAVPAEEATDILPPVPRQRMSPPEPRADRSAPEPSVRGSNAPALVSRPPPPQFDRNRKAEQSGMASQPHSRTKSDNDSASPRPPSPAPPRPASRPPVMKETTSRSDAEGGDKLAPESAEEDSSAPALVCRPPPPHLDDKPEAEEATPQPPGRTQSGSDPAPPRPPSPAPPRPSSRPLVAKDVASAESGGEGGQGGSPTPRHAPPVKRKEHSMEEEQDELNKQPPRPAGPPRPVSMPPVRSPLTAASTTAQSPKDKGERPSRPQPMRPAAPAPKEGKAGAGLPLLPPRPGPSHPLYGYMMSEPHAVAAHDYSANHNDELPFEEGSTIVLLERVDDQWLKGKVGDREGIFPQNFVSVIHPLHDELPSSAIDDFIDGAFEDALQEKPDLLTGPRCRARFDFEGEGQGDLPFEDGDVIQLITHCGNDWLKGELNGKVGMFPASFVEIIEDLPEGKDGADVSGKESGEKVALFDFDGEVGELSFQAGDKIQITSKVNDQWLYGKCEGREGSFPATFVDGFPPNLPLHMPSSSLQKTPAAQAEKPESLQTSSTQQLKTYCTALYSFEGQQEGDLQFREGDRIEILENQGQEWLRGRLHGKEGSFPAAFVQMDEDAGNQGSGDQADNPMHGTGLDSHSALVHGVALFDFAGETDGELTFKAGDEIVLGSLVSEGSEWQWGEVNGKSGIFPAAFVEMS